LSDKAKLHDEVQYDFRSKQNSTSFDLVKHPEDSAHKGLQISVVGVSYASLGHKPTATVAPTVTFADELLATTGAYSGYFLGIVPQTVDSFLDNCIRNSDIKTVEANLSFHQSFLELHLAQNSRRQLVDYVVQHSDNAPYGLKKLAKQLWNNQPCRPDVLPMQLPADHNGQLSVPPQKWSLTFDDFRSVLYFAMITTSELGFEKLQKSRDAHVSLYDLNSCCIKPWTNGTNASIAVLMNPDGLAAQLMVSHAWAEECCELEAAMDRYWDNHELRKDIPLWFCQFAIYQAGKPGPSIEDQLKRDPFESVIKSQSLLPANGGYGMVAVHTTTVDLYSRLWCPYEIFEADKAEVPIQMAPSDKYAEKLEKGFQHNMKLCGHNLPEVRNTWKFLHVNTSSASCSSPDDRKRIAKCIEESEGGFERMDKVIREVRWHMAMSCLDENETVDQSVPARTLRAVERLGENVRAASTKIDVQTKLANGQQRKLNNQQEMLASQKKLLQEQQEKLDGQEKMLVCQNKLLQDQQTKMDRQEKLLQGQQEKLDRQEQLMQEMVALLKGRS